MPTLFDLHVAEWRNCQRCDLAETRTRVCHLRGTIPADVAFVGEAPGESEDVIGKTFIGPAGKLLDHIIKRALADYTYALMNLVGCIPRNDEADGTRTKASKAGQPSVESIEACAPRLVQLMTFCKPRLIVAVGALARDYLDPKYQDCILQEYLAEYNTPVIDITHPAAILRMKIVQRGFQIQRAVVILQEALYELDNVEEQER